MRKIVILLSLMCLLLIGADKPVDTVRLTVINKTGMKIAIQLRSKDNECANSKEILRGEFYYLTLIKGTQEEPYIKAFDLKRGTYGMQLFYLETYDPVYGYKCSMPAPNALIAQRNIRLVVMPCDFKMRPKQVGEPSMRKFIPYPNLTYAMLFQRYWASRLVH